MNFLSFAFAARVKSAVAVLVTSAFLMSAVMPAYAMDAALNGALPRPLPLLPADNWWNQDIRNWPVDPNSSSYIAFINNGGTRRLHPDFGGNAAPAQSPNAIYGIPYAVVSNVTNGDLKSVQFDYWDESDGVDKNTGTSFPFYPIPAEAITQPHWIEGGDPGNVDLRNSQDRHMLIVDRDRNYLYELYNVYYSATQGKWLAGSGAFFDMNSNQRRPNGWTSADAAGLAILPGLIRYDEVYDPSIADIGHAFRVTVRATNGYVYPASHRAGSTAGALPMGARLRLKSTVDVSQRTSDPNIQKIFRSMQKYGLIVADNGSDMYLTGTYDTRWNNDILNPAFAALTANDFDVVRLGYTAPLADSIALSSVGINPSNINAGQSATGSVYLTAPAPAGGISIALSSANPAAVVPSSVTVPALATTAAFPVSSVAVGATTSGNISATYSGVTKTAVITVNPVKVALSSLTLKSPTVIGGLTTTGTVLLNGPAPQTGAVVTLASSKPARARVPATVTVPAGISSASFEITTTAVRSNTAVTINASYGGVTRKTTLTIQKR